MWDKENVLEIDGTDDGTADTAMNQTDTSRGDEIAIGEQNFLPQNIPLSHKD